MEAEPQMRKFPTDVSHYDFEVRELQKDRELAAEYLRLAVESLAQNDERAVGLLMLKTLNEAYGNLAPLAAESGVGKDVLYQRVSQVSIPKFDTVADYEVWFNKEILRFGTIATVPKKLA
jgi:DNA-binding phage protein